MSYIVESGTSSSRRRRRRRAAITLFVVAALLFGAFWYAYSYYREPPPRASAGPACTPTSSPRSTLPAPGKVSVNVYNATDRDGLAAGAAEQLRGRGFRVLTVANDPLHKKVAGPAEVRFGKSGRPAAQVVQRLVKGATAVKDARTDASVDLVLGRTFTALLPAPVPSTPATGGPSSTATC